MSDFVEQCRSEWRRLGVPDPLAEEMAADLASDLSDAEAEGVSAEELPRKQCLRSAFVRCLLGGRARYHPRTAQPRERPPQTARPRGVHRPCSDRTGRYGAAAPDRAAHGLSRRDQNSSTSPCRAATGLLRTTRREPASPPHKRIRPGRVDPAVLRDRRARLRCLAVDEVGSLATTHCPRLGVITGDAPARSPIRALLCRFSGSFSSRAHDEPLDRDADGIRADRLVEIEVVVATW